ncbi:MAG: response regulator [Alphaproteobacteria bacterium]|nr:response regulator [Alphaproteobacteria bacterium]
MKICVVDDNLHMRKLLCELLEFLEVSEIRECGDGEEALKALQLFDADLCILDLCMTPMDGMTFLEHLRTDADSPNQQLPVIMITGIADRSVVEEARDRGATEFMVKPITVTALFSRICEVLECPREFITSTEYLGPDRRRQVKAPPRSKRWDDLGSARNTLSQQPASPAENLETANRWKNALKRRS